MKLDFGKFGLSLVLGAAIATVDTGFVKAQSAISDEEKFNETIVLSGEQNGVKLNFRVPDEGYYGCRWFLHKDKNKQPFFGPSGDDLLNSGYLGFDLFKNGTLRLRKNDKTFSSEVYNWRHNPESGRVVFVDGPLAELFKWPTPISIWYSKIWTAGLRIDNYVNQDGSESWVQCQNKDPLQSMQK